MTVTHDETWPATDEVLDYAAAAAYTTLGRTTLFEAIRAGELRSIKVGRARRFLRSDLDAWLASKRTVAQG